eukprot:scaffold599_cov130-Isochrysis_galbana.AAC.9
MGERMSESALSGGTSPVWPWTGARRLASCVPGASCSRAWVLSIGGSVMIALHVTKTSTLPKHQARGDEARKAQGGGERNLHLVVFGGRWAIARGPSHTPFGGVGSLANTYRRCGANWSFAVHTLTASPSVGTIVLHRGRHRATLTLAPRLRAVRARRSRPIFISL